ncbi:hypothetical protein [Limosilactobacillus sp.]|uniref:hypothetical protein n=1 Tax=Limosilactobacillus sp. TaxID=2773925 RepID=UPI003EFFB6B3
MKTKLLILPVAMMMGLAVSAPVSADTTSSTPTRVEIEAQGNQRIQSLWNQYQQALQERENAWEESKGNRFTPAYITADAKAGAIYQEWLRAQTQLGDNLHNYDVDQWQKEQDQQQANQPDQPSQQPQQNQQATATQASQASQASSDQPQVEATKTDQPQAKASIAQPSQQVNVEPKSTTHSPQQATTRRVSDKTANLPAQNKKPVQNSTEQNTKQAELPQTGNANPLAAVGALLLAFWTALTGVWKRL